MEEERIEAVKNWPEPKSIQDIQVFIGFANFYQRFIQSFSKIAAPLTSILKTSASQSHTSANKLDNGTNRSGADVDGFGFGSNEKSSKSKNKKLAKSRKSSGNNRAMEEPNFLTPEARSAFNLLRQAFTKAPILRHFDLECHIQIETDVSGYAIGGVLSQLTFNQVTSLDSIFSKSDFGQWHPVAYFLER